MRKSTHRMLSFAVLGVIFIPTMVLADFKSEIIESCSAYQQGNDRKEVNACKLYIDGFIDSSLLTEDAVIQTKAMINNRPKEQSAFLQRAYRTRVNDPAFLNSHKEYQFCIPRDYDRKVITSRIAKSLNIDQLANKPLKEVLLETLIDNFRCK